MRGAEDALQPSESAVLHKSFTTESLSSSTDVSIRYNLVEIQISIVYTIQFHAFSITQSIGPTETENTSDAAKIYLRKLGHFYLTLFHTH